MSHRHAPIVTALCVALSMLVMPTAAAAKFPPPPSQNCSSHAQCDDGSLCTTEYCHPKSRVCVYEPACDDGDLCTNDGCHPTKGCRFTPKCNDGLACTADVCNPWFGHCSHPAVSCNDGDSCTTDSCVEGTGCVNTPTSCDDGDPCTIDACDPATGQCSSSPACDDGDPCTIDACNPGTGACSALAACDDGDPCTVDACDPGTGQCSSTAACDDGNPCTVDSCSPATGACGTAPACDDGDPCTTDSCDPANGQCSASAACDDGEVCTTDSCDSATGACTNDPVVCDDGVACTTDACWAGYGCISVRDDGACQDGNSCTTDTCTLDGCQVAAQPNCADNTGVNLMYAAVWDDDPAPRRIRRDETWSQFTASWQQQAADGYRLIDLDPKVVGTTTFYNSVYRQQSGGYGLWVTTDAAQLQAKVAEWSNLQLIDVEVWFDAYGTKHYAGVWLGSGTARVVTDMTWGAFGSERSAQQADGHRLVDVEVLELGDGTLRYSGVFRPGTEMQFMEGGKGWDEFANRWMSLIGLRLVDIEVYGEDQRYIGLWVGPSNNDRVTGGQEWGPLNRLDDRHVAQGRGLVDIEFFWGHPTAPVAYADAMYDSFNGSAMGYSYALAKDGAILGYGAGGFARAPWEPTSPGVAMRPWTKMDIASIAKAITASAFLTLGEPLFTPFYPYIDGQYPTIGTGMNTVRFWDLFRHESGLNATNAGGTNLGNQTCARNGTFTSNMSEVLSNPQITPVPTVERYNNFNYCIVRAAMDTLVPNGYAQYVQDTVFRPLGIMDFTNQEAAFAPTRYYMPTTNPPTNTSSAGNTQDMTSEAGPSGWFGSSVGLIRWLMGLRNQAFLDSVETSLMRTSRIGFRATTNPWHDGVWNFGGGGFRGIVVAYDDGYDAVTLVNTQVPATLAPTNAARNALLAFPD